MYVICSPTMAHPFKPDEERLVAGEFPPLPDTVPELLRVLIADCLKVGPAARPTVNELLQRVRRSGRRVDPELCRQLDDEKLTGKEKQRRPSSQLEPYPKKLVHQLSSVPSAKRSTNGA